MSKPAHIAVGIGIAGITAGGLYWLGALDPVLDRSRGAIAACEEEISSGLASPSSFTPVWTNFAQLPPLTEEEYHEKEKTEQATARNKDDMARAYGDYMERVEKTVRAKIAQGQKLKPGDEQDIGKWVMSEETRKKERAARRAKNLPADQTGHVTIEYDAANAFGTKLRAFAMCRFGPIGDDGRFQRSEIIVTGPIPSSVGEQTKQLSEQAQ